MPCPSFALSPSHCASTLDLIDSSCSVLDVSRGHLLVEAILLVLMPIKRLLEPTQTGTIPIPRIMTGLQKEVFTEAEANERLAARRNYARFVGLNNPAEREALEQINNAIATIATSRNLTMAQIALAWSLSNKFVSAPIVGTTNLDSLKELVRATHVVLTEEEKKSISDPYMPRGILGH